VFLGGEVLLNTLSPYGVTEESPYSPPPLIPPQAGDTGRPEILLKKNIFQLITIPLSAFSFQLSIILPLFWRGLGGGLNYLFNKICFILFISDIEHTNQFGIQGI
jgi:hypothetical protein